MSNYTYPLASFYFEVSVGKQVVQFQEVSGLEFQVELEDLSPDAKSGGQKMGAPIKRTFSNITMKRGVMDLHSDFFEWISKSFDPQEFTKVKPRDIDIYLFDEKKNIAFSWQAIGAFPIKWSFGSLNSMKNEVMLETIEFQPREITFEAGW